ncbi:complex I assembly factor ACAD9, mitochondrial [Condylostylus longicornis]|uniref:complex I assembly factor ACAD9, mitochondrial n=1 Tax=Condylostylus longicornis TaxID=2530218 RepID=UPI00244DBC64|nr:complex I assembly factor ACAD9, mitochondrial [Condylostylus longicornis]
MLSGRLGISNLQRFTYNLCKNAKYSSIPDEQKTSIIKDENQFKEKIIHTKIRAKLPARPPLAKNFFLGNVDKELLAFPEVISRDEMSKLQEETKMIEQFFENFNQTDSNKLKNNLIDELRKGGLFGLNISQIYDGKEYIWSEGLIASQFEIKQPDTALLLLGHRIVCDVINVYGTEEQKQKYLPSLANGSLVAVDAVIELRNNNNPYFNTTADFDAEQDVWVLNGEKILLPVQPKVDILLVLAETPKLHHSGDSLKDVTLFVVDITKKGVKINTPKNFLNYTTVEFENVHLYNDEIIGKVNEGSEVAQLLLQNHRIRSSYVGFGLIRKVINDATKYVTENKLCAIELRNMESITTCLSKMVCNAYAIESMIYFTTGLMDEFEKPDTEIETAMVKLFTQNSLWNASVAVMDFLGAAYLQPEREGESIIKNIMQIYLQGESVDSLKLFVALSGLRHAGMSLHENINKQRNPLYHPKHMINKFFQSTSIDFPKTNIFLNEHLHPSLEPAAQNLEHSIYRLFACTEILLTRYGSEVVQKHSEIKRLAEMATLVYATFACLARSSRSYCIGLKLSDFEILLASAVAQNARDRIKELAKEIEQGPYITNDVNYQRLSKKLLESKGYFSENPLTYNF